MPFCHLRLIQTKPKNDSYLWKPSRYPEHPKHIGEQILKRRHDLKMPAHECQKILGVDKGTLTKWEQGKHRPNPANLAKINQFLGYGRIGQE
jgi:DNA-binding transcriptional regulator YiaG